MMIDLGITIVAANAILSTVPKVAELIEKSIAVMNAVRAMRMDEEKMPVVIVQIIKKEQALLQKLINEYYDVDDDPTLDSKEKKDYKKRIAAKICELLLCIQPIRKSIDGYDIIREMYCNSIPDALRASPRGGESAEVIRRSKTRRGESKTRRGESKTRRGESKTRRGEETGRLGA